jgi:propanol-preferring alcohol dehydrogenase
MEERPEPKPGPGQIRVAVEACGVCRTDLHVVDGELPDIRLPIVPGHEIVGRVEAIFTGYTRDGGYATHTIADAAFAFPLPDNVDPVASAPLLCAGLIGWRSLKAAGDGQAIGIYGFGAAAHIIAQVCRWQGRSVSRSPSGPTGPADRTRNRPSRSTPPSSLRRSARSCRRRSLPFAKGGGWSAAAST